MNRRFPLMVALVALALGVVAGCGSPATPSAGSTQAPAARATAAPAGADPTAAPAGAEATAAPSTADATSAPAAGEFQPDGPVSFVVHTGPGGGSDLFARALVDLMQNENLLGSTWTVRNEQGGSGASAMAYMSGLAGETETVAAITPSWISTPLTNAEAASVTLADLTPIAQLTVEPAVLAVRADAPYETLQDVVDAAKQQPGKLIQAGGSPTSAPAIAGEIIKAATGADWSYLSFEGGGERIAALLGGNADMIIAEPIEVVEQVRANELKVIATVGPERTTLFPDAPTLAESGVDVDVPQQFRGIVGPPDMPAEAVAYYQNLVEQAIATDAWSQYVSDNGVVTQFRPSDEWGSFLEEQNTLLKQVLTDLDLLDQ